MLAISYLNIISFDTKVNNEREMFHNIVWAQVTSYPVKKRLNICVSLFPNGCNRPPSYRTFFFHWSRIQLVRPTFLPKFKCFDNNIRTVVITIVLKNKLGGKILSKKFFQKKIFCSFLTVVF